MRWVNPSRTVAPNPAPPFALCMDCIIYLELGIRCMYSVLHVYLHGVHICSLFSLLAMSRFLESSPMGDRSKGELLVELNSQLTNNICLFMSVPFSFHNYVPWLTMCCSQWWVIMWSASKPRTASDNSSRYCVIGCFLLKRADALFQFLCPLLQEKLQTIEESWLTNNQGKGWLYIL